MSIGKLSGITCQSEKDGVTRITVGSGRHHNALTTADWRQLAGVAATLSAKPKLRAVVIRGYGNTFCSGADISEWDGASTADVENAFESIEQALLAVEAIPVPVIAQVQGTAAGAGCQLALACDIRVMSSSGWIGMPVVRLGIFVNRSFTRRIADLVGLGLASDLLYTGRLISGAEAYHAGLVSHAVKAEEVEAETAKILEAISGMPGHAVRAAKAAITFDRRWLRWTTPQEHTHDVTAWTEFRDGVRSFLSEHQLHARRTGKGRKKASEVQCRPFLQNLVLVEPARFSELDTRTRIDIVSPSAFAYAGNRQANPSSHP
jgi:enoyl-CoA hydratase/carnithine racemase